MSLAVAYYNECDPKAAAWLRELINAGLIAYGFVDERSIEDVKPNELIGYTQCHFFAGIGGWSYALRLAGWPDDWPIWTGSCPCQPFSSAGKGAGFADERHLWPAFHHLIAQCKPDVVIGEQVASKDGLAWFDLVQADLEGAGYAAGAVDICAAGVGSPHIRQRLYWMADSESRRKRNSLVEKDGGAREHRTGGSAGRVADGISTGLEGHGWHGYRSDEPGRLEAQSSGSVATAGDIGGMADSASERCGEARQNSRRPEERIGDGGEHGRMADAEGQRQCADQSGSNSGKGEQLVRAESGSDGGNNGAIMRSSPTNGQWRDADWLFCRDGKWRPVEPGTFPLADGVSARVGRLRGYGNAIVPQVAKAFIEGII